MSFRDEHHKEAYKNDPLYGATGQTKEAMLAYQRAMAHAKALQQAKLQKPAQKPVQRMPKP